MQRKDRYLDGNLFLFINFNKQTLYSAFLAPRTFLAWTGFCDLRTALARRRAADLRSRRYLFDFIKFLSFDKERLGPAFIVTLTVFLAGRFWNHILEKKGIIIFIWDNFKDFQLFCKHCFIRNSFRSSKFSSLVFGDLGDKYDHHVSKFLQCLIQNEWSFKFFWIDSHLVFVLLVDNCESFLVCSWNNSKSFLVYKSTVSVWTQVGQIVWLLQRRFY